VTPRTGFVIAVAAAFLMGCALGLMGGILFSRTLAGPHPPRWAERGRARPSAERMMRRLERRLELTDTQSAHIRAWVEQAHLEARASRESLRARIDAELSEDQRARWRAMEMERRRPGSPRGPEHGRPNDQEEGP
jgi:hypothetical protein